MVKNKRIIGLCLALIICFIGLFAIVPNNFTAYAQGKEVYIGGTPIGLVATCDGLIVSNFAYISVDSIKYSPAEKAGMRVGDIIMSVDDISHKNIFTLNEYISKHSGEIKFSIKRGEATKTVAVQPIFDKQENAYKVGVLVKNDVSGIGTLTYITEDKTYGALGHFVFDSYGYNTIYQKGIIYNAKLTGFRKGQKGMAGELKGNILLSQPIGTIYKNTISGVFGIMNSNEYRNSTKFLLGSQSDVKVGEASIYTSIDSAPPQFYKIEIVKAQKQSVLEDKSMVIRITDETLLKKTGGILQGMSGSPIVQNNKIIGAVTHVFINDPTIGYGIYVDWMINN